MAADKPIQAARATRTRSRDRSSGVLFAVYAPFGDDPVLSRFPGQQPQRVQDHPLFANLLAVAGEGVNVCALIDLADDCSYLVEIPASLPTPAVVTPAWKLAMSAPCTLAGFLERAHHRFPCAALVLALEGHGAGYLPEVDGAAVSPISTNGEDGWFWQVGADGSTLLDADGNVPVLPVGSPTPPLDLPDAAGLRLPMSTWALGEALRRARVAGVPAPAVLHLNNCFNMSLELLDTIARHVGHVTGYANYNFFTAGDAYPGVFRRLRTAGGATAAELARWFAEGNRDQLAAKGNHPTLGACLPARRIRRLSAATGTLARALTAELQPPNPADRPAVRDRIRNAIRRAQQFDGDNDFALEVPDAVSDLGSLAGALQQAFPGTPVSSAAADVLLALQGAKVYGAFDRPWLREELVWDFRSPLLGVNLFLPDPDLTGVWDWRSAYYMTGNEDPAQPPSMAHQIGFLRDQGGVRPPWVQFLVEYHRDVPFLGFTRVQIPRYPVFNAEFKPSYPPPGKGDPGTTGRESGCD